MILAECNRGLSTHCRWDGLVPMLAPRNERAIQRCEHYPRTKRKTILAEYNGGFSTLPVGWARSRAGTPQ